MRIVFHPSINAMKSILIFLLMASPIFAQEASVTDEIVVKATDAVMFQITANMHLTQDQTISIREIIADYTVKVRNLQLKLQAGDIDGKTMYTKRQELIVEEDKELSQILSPDQMKVWLNIQNP